MPMEGMARVALAVILATALSACVTLPPNSPRSPQDPWESWNRGVYKFNDALDRRVAKPVAKTYVKIVPEPFRKGVSNFFANLKTPTVMVNDALQGKFLAAANDLGRFVLDTTVGLAGILDPATPAGLDRNNEDFGQTLGKWGVHPGPFIELPILGPSDLRDFPALAVDAFTYPPEYASSVWIQYGVYLPYFIDQRAALLPLDETLSKIYDPYAFIRDAYLQQRAFLVSDGKITDEVLVDPGADVPDVVPPNVATPNTSIQPDPTAPPSKPAKDPASPPPPR